MSSPWLVNIAKAFGLPADTDAATIMQAAAALKARADAASGSMTLEQRAAQAGKVVLTVDEANTLHRAARLGLAEATLNDHLPGSGDPNPKLSEIETGDRALLNLVVDEAAFALNVDYRDALDRYLNASEAARRAKGADARLSDVTGQLRITLDLPAVERELQQDRGHVIALSADPDALTDAPEGEVVTLGGRSHVRFPEHVDVATLLHDPAAPTRAYFEAQRAGLVTADRETFERAWSDRADMGFDLVGELRLERHSENLERVQVQAEERRQTRRMIARQEAVRQAERDAEAAIERAKTLGSKSMSDVRF